MENMEKEMEAIKMQTAKELYADSRKINPDDVDISSKDFKDFYKKNRFQIENEASRIFCEKNSRILQARIQSDMSLVPSRYADERMQRFANKFAKTTPSRSSGSGR